jgi:hypothetical protein
VGIKEFGIIPKSEHPTDSMLLSFQEMGKNHSNTVGVQFSATFVA